MENIYKNLIIFWIVFSSGSVYFMRFHQESLCCFVVLVLIFFFVYQKRTFVDGKYVLVVLFICFTAFLTMIENLDFSHYALYYMLIFNIIISACIPFIIGFDELREKYIKLVVFLAFSSLIMYLIINMMPNLISYFPVIELGAGGQKYHNLFSLVYAAPQYHFTRNSSVFWEPGAFQAFINLAYYFEVTRHGLKHYARIFILSIALVTTFSTTGYIVFGLMNLIFFMNKRYYLIFTLIAILVLTMCVLLGLVPGGSLIKNIVINKMSLENYSFLVRYVSSMTDLDIFSKAPILGEGYHYFELVSQNSMRDYGVKMEGSVDSLTYSMAVFGGLFSVTLLLVYFIAVMSQVNSYVHRAVYFILLLLIFATENFFCSFIWLSVAFYGLKFYFTKKVHRPILSCDV